MKVIPIYSHGQKFRSWSRKYVLGTKCSYLPLTTSATSWLKLLFVAESEKERGCKEMVRIISHISSLRHSARVDDMQTCLSPRPFPMTGSPPRSSSSYQLIGEWKCHEKTIHNDWTEPMAFDSFIYLRRSQSGGRKSNEKDFIMRGLHFHINWSVPRQKSIDALLPWHLTKGLIDTTWTSSSSRS